MNCEDLTKLIGQHEGPKLEFKQEYDLDDPDKAHKRDEFVKDVLALVNTASGLANQPAHLIIGVGDKLLPDGTRDLYNAGSYDLSSLKFLEIINARCDPPLSQLDYEIVEIDCKRIGVLTIPPSPHIHHTIRDLITGPGKVYRRGTVFVRRAERVDIATPADIEAIQEEKARWNKLQIDDGRLRAHLEAVMRDARYVRWGDQQYIDGQIKPLPMNVSISEAEVELESLPRRELLPAVENKEQVVILGEPGSGKTTALECLMLVYARRALQKPDRTSPFPIFIPLSEYSGEESLLPLVRASLNEHKVLSLTVEQTDALLLNVSCLIMLDGLNELPGDFCNKGLAVIRKFARTYSHSRYIFTCRTHEYKEQLGQVETLVIQELDNRDVLGYLRAHLGTGRGKNLYGSMSERLRGLARNPLMLSMIRDAGTSGRLPQNRGELFQSFTDHLLAGIGKPGERGKRIGRGLKKGLLADLAYTMQIERVLRLPLDRLLEMARPLGARFGYSPWEILDDLLFNGVVRVTGSDQDRCQFMHQSVQEYFAAVALTKKSEEEIVSLALDGEQSWKEIIVLLCGLLSDPSIFIAKIAHKATWLAARCLLEGKEPDEDSKLVVVNRLVYNLDSHNSSVRARSARLLGKIGHPAAVDGLVCTIRDTNKAVRSNALGALVSIGEPAVAPLIAALRSSQGGIHRSIITALGNIGDRSAIAALIPDLGAETHTSGLAAKTISQFGQQAVEPLICALSHYDWRVRLQVVWLLGRIRDNRAIGPLVSAFRDEDSNVSYRAVRALVKFGAPAIDPLVSALHDDDKHVRRCAKKTLLCIFHPAAISALVSLLKSGNAHLALDASRVLESWCREPRAISAFVELLASPSEDVRVFAKQALRKLARDPKATRMLRKHGYPELVEPLISALEDRSWELRCLATEALARTNDFRTVGALIVALNDKHVKVRRAAAEALEVLGDATLTSPLITGLDDPDRRVSESVTNALSAIGKPAVEHLVDVLGSEQESVRRAATNALRKIGSSAVEALTNALRDQDPRVCYHAIVALGDIGELDAIGPLLGCLGSKDVEVRYAAVEALGKLRAKEAVPELEQIIEQDRDITKWNKQVAQAARVALVKIQRRGRPSRTDRTEEANCKA